MYNLALLYIEGKARPRDMTRAAALLKSAAASRQSPKREYVLAQLYDNGQRRRRRTSSAPPSSFADAARLGHVAAEVEYAIRLFNGVGTEKDEAQAATWFRRAADLGNPIAQNRLARILATGTRRPGRSGRGRQVALPRQRRRQERRLPRQLRRRADAGPAAAGDCRRPALAGELICIIAS